MQKLLTPVLIVISVALGAAWYTNSSELHEAKRQLLTTRFTMLNDSGYEPIAYLFKHTRQNPNAENLSALTAAKPATATGYQLLSSPQSAIRDNRSRLGYLRKNRPRLGDT